MQVKKSQITALSNLILKEISTQIREIIREEFELNTKSFKRQILESLKAKNVVTMKPNREVSKATIQKPVHIVKQSPNHLIEKKKIDTGSDLINEILDTTPALEDGPSTIFDETDFSVFDKIDFNPTTSFQEASKQSINETRRMNSGNDVYKPAPGEAINFDPNTMDASKIDWGEFVDKVDERVREKPL